MKNDYYFITKAAFDEFVAQLKNEYAVFLPERKEPSARPEPDYSYTNAPGASFTFNPYRTIEPLKAFFTHCYEKVSDYFLEGKNVTDVAEETVIFGVKGCDIAGHAIQDFVFLEGPESDSLYKVRRDAAIFVVGDCTEFKEVCHCLAWGIMPYPTKGFDLAMAPVDNGYLIEVGSEKGRKLIEDHARYFTVAQEGHINTRLRHRDELVERLKRHLAPQKLVAREEVQKIVKEGYTCDIWHEYMQTCVECGGCNLICDTCHCFLLADKPQDFSPAGQVQGKRTRMWDSCLYANYARVAGGANPLKLRAQRLRNRFMKKFDFFVEVLAMPACCGCGRCIEVCPGKIDIREVLKSLGEHHRALQHKETE